jgi:hypothetical protein
MVAPLILEIGRYVENCLKNRVSDILHNYLASRVALIRPIYSGFRACDACGYCIFRGWRGYLSGSRPSQSLRKRSRRASIEARVSMPREQNDWSCHLAPRSTSSREKDIPDRAAIRK